MKIWMKLSSLFRREKLDADMAEEMRLHLERRTQANIAAGMSYDEARYAAQRQFGGVDQLKEIAREQRRWAWLDQLWQDLRYGARSLRKSPGFTSVVVLTLALGIGVNMALFTWFNAAVFRPLPVAQPEQLFALNRLDANGRLTKSMAYADFVAYRDHQTVFTGLAASSENGVQPIGATEFSTATGEKSAGFRIETVSADYFAVFGVPMALGRPLLATDENSTRAQPVIVLNYSFWQLHFGGDPGVIGRTLRLSGLAEEALTIVGVAGPEFHGTKPKSLAGWVPLLMRRGDAWRTDPKATNYTLTGRLRPGVSREQAAEQLQAITNEFLARPHAGTTKSATIILTEASAYFNLSPKQLAMLLPMMGLFGAVLLTSCANATNLILARAVTRQFEFGVRSAIGATRWRLFKQIMTESLMLGVLGGLAGWSVAAGLLRFAWPWLLDMLPGASDEMEGLYLHADYRVLGFTLVISMLAGAAGGLLPAFQVTRRNVDSALKREGSAFGRAVGLSRVRSILSVAQLALSAALLFTAGLLVNRVLKTQFQDVGFDKSRLLTLEVLAPLTYSASQFDQARRQVFERLRALPEVAAVAEMPKFPFALSRMRMSAPTADQAAGRLIDVIHVAVPSNYFATLQLPLVRGRPFAADETASDAIAIISETAARAFWPDGDALGQRLDVRADIPPGRDANVGIAADDASLRSVSMTVIGIARDTRVYDPWSGDRPIVYLPLAPQTDAAPYLLVRTHNAAELSRGEFRQVGRDATGVAPRIIVVEELLANAFLQHRVMASLAGILAVLSLIVAVTGLHGVMSFTVNQRIKEIGIRIALGATPGRVVSRIVWESLRLVGAGTALGYGLSVAISVVARKMLQGVDAFDPLAGVAVILLLASIGVLACWMPARRAAKVDPMVVLRTE